MADRSAFRRPGRSRHPRSARGSGTCAGPSAPCSSPPPRSTTWTARSSPFSSPPCEHSIGMTEVGYGYIVDAFQVAYALGLLAAGRFVDKVGTRIGYMVIMAVWSLSAMGHALANTVLEFGIARFCLGLGESGNFPAAIKTVAEWFPQSERSLATGIFNSGANRGRHPGSAHRALGDAFAMAGTRPFWSPASSARCGSCCGSASTASPPTTPRSPAPNCATSTRKPLSSWGPPRRGSSCSAYRQTWAFTVGKFLTDPIWWFYLFWLPSYFSARFHLDLSHLGLPLIIVYNASTVGSIGGGWLPAPFRRLGLSPPRRGWPPCSSAPAWWFPSSWSTISTPSGPPSGCSAWPRPRTRAGRPISSPPPRICFRAAPWARSPASAAWPERPAARCLATYAGYILQLTHSYASLFAIAASAYLAGTVHHRPACSRTEESGVSRMSLYCAIGSVDTDLSPRQLNDLLAESLAKLGAAQQRAGRAARSEPRALPRRRADRLCVAILWRPAQGGSSRARHAHRHAAGSDRAHVRRCAAGSLPRS